MTAVDGSGAPFVAPRPTAPLVPGPRPSFSVIIAAWQAADVITTAVGSAVAQTRPPFEIVVCDDGSTDDIGSALAPFGDAVRLIRIPHAGESVARNAAAAECTGEFVVTLDADDFWEPRRLERMGDLAVAHPHLDVITTDAWFIVDGERRGRFYDFNTFSDTDQAVEIMRRNFFFAHVAVRRRMWEKFGGYEPGLTRGQDWDMWLRLILGGCSAGCVMEPLAGYAIHDASVSADRYRSMLARVEVLDRAEAQHRLSGEQHRALVEARAGFRRRALAARAEQLLITGEPGRRRASVALMCTRGASRRVRLLSAAAAIAPDLAGARLRRAAMERGRAATDRVVGPPPGDSPTSPPD